MKPEKIHYLIIGAGPTGLGAACRLKERGEENFLVLEQSDRAGGLAASVVDEKGFTWDIGGHVQYSHYPYFDQLMDKALPPEGWLQHQRSAWALMCGGFVPYPMQNNLRYLPKEELWECIQGLLEINRKKPAPPENFREWILATFGAGLARLFMLPYNAKVWAHPPEQMSYQWIGERMAVSDLEKTLQNIINETDDLSWGPNSLFRFPLEGGTGAIWERVAEMVGREKILLNTPVDSINYKTREVITAEGKSYQYKHLISTMPIDLLVGMMRPSLRPKYSDATQKLRHTSTHIVGLGLKGQCPDYLQGKSWIYFPEDNAPFHRVSVFSNYSPHNVPDASRYWSLLTETSESEHKPVNQETLVEEIIRGVVDYGLVDSRTQVWSVWKRRLEHGYPVPSLKRDEQLRTIIRRLEKSSIYSRGRFGGWKYEMSNQDHSVMQGVELIDYLAEGKPETIYTP
jgi:protoporphyrinogen oxidase